MPAAAHRTRASARRTYVVDHYRPGLGPDELRHLAERVRDAVAGLANEGKADRWIDSTVVPEDEYFQSVLEASSKGLVREVHARAGVTFERMSIAIRIDE